MKNIRIATISRGLVIALIITSLLQIGSAGLIMIDVHAIKNIWSQFDENRSKKAHALDNLTADIGYGGMIHQFKNYVLRQDISRIEKIQFKSGGVESALDDYESQGVTDAEKQAIADIRVVIRAYAENLLLAQSLVDQGRSPEDIDKIVKIDDTPALTGLKTLSRFVARETQTKQRNAEPQESNILNKAALAADIRRAIGYGGMIHEFKNFVLRKDQNRIAKTRDKAEEALRLLDIYRTLDINDVERQALQDIARTIRLYDQNLAHISTAAQKGDTATDIDKIVKIDDGPALKGFLTLQRAFAQQTDQQAHQISTAFDQMTILLYVLVAGLIILTISLVISFLWAMSSRIAQPIESMTQAMTRLSRGETDLDLYHLEGKNEIGQMVKAVQIFRDHIIEKNRMPQENIETHAAKPAYSEEVNSLISHFEHNTKKTIDAFCQATKVLKTTSQSMSSLTEQTSAQTSAVAAASEQASANVQSVAKAVEDLYHAIDMINTQMAESDKVRQEAVLEAQKASEDVQGLNSASQKIGEVVALISSIAEQTNLLALNATIEAARAGDAGKGFAVVAGEVKNLASQTGKATEDITHQIQDVQTSTAQAVLSINKITSIIDKVNTISSRIADSIHQQDLATHEISKNVQEAATGTQEVSANVQILKDAAREERNAALDVFEASENLTKQSDSITQEIESFLGNIRANRL